MLARNVLPCIMSKCSPPRKLLRFHRLACRGTWPNAPRPKIFAACATSRAGPRNTPLRQTLFDFCFHDLGSDAISFPTLSWWCPRLAQLESMKLKDTHGGPSGQFVSDLVRCTSWSTGPAGNLNMKSPSADSDSEICTCFSPLSRIMLDP